MITIVYLNHDSGGLHYEQFDTDAEAIQWMQENEWKAIVVEGPLHKVSDHT